MRNLIVHAYLLDRVVEHIMCFEFRAFMVLCPSRARCSEHEIGMIVSVQSVTV